MEITPAEIPALKELHRVAFGDSDAYIDFFFSRRFHPELCVAAFEGKDAVSAVYARLLSFTLFSRPVTLPFLTGVATMPHRRGQGLASKLVLEMHERLKAAGYPLVLLHPFNHDFYRRLGYGTLSCVAPAPCHRNADCTARAATPDDLPAMAALYRTRFATASFRRDRTERDWQEIWQEHTQDGGTVSVIERSGAVIGYYMDGFGSLRESVSTADSYPVDFPYAPFSPATEGREWTMGCVLNPDALRPYLPSELQTGVRAGGEWIAGAALGSVGTPAFPLCMLEKY